MDGGAMAGGGVPAHLGLDFAGALLDADLAKMTGGWGGGGGVCGEALTIILDGEGEVVGLLGGGGNAGAGSFANKIGTGGGMEGFMNFAKGGIMTKDGELPLQRYAKGGIARKPQVAIYGEGSQNEAYVPLPDGRTIPVTMTGKGEPQKAPNVTVNVAR